MRELFERGIRVHILNMGLIENTLTGNLIPTVMLAFAEREVHNEEEGAEAPSFAV